MSPAGPQILTASQLAAAGTPAPSSQIRPSPFARASSLFQQVHLAAPPSSAAHHGRSNSSPLNSADGSSPTRTGFQFELPTLRVPDGLRLPDGMRLPDGIRLPDFDLPKFELGPAWAQFRARFVPQNTEEELPSLPELCIKGYEPQGEWKRMGDWRVYCVGPDPSLDCLIGASDIFGSQTLQTIQGADILHHLTGATVYVPDFFQSAPFPTTMFPPRTPEQVRELQVFFEGRANIDDNRDALVAFGTALRERFRRGVREDYDVDQLEESTADRDDACAPGDGDWNRWVRVGCYGVSWGGKLSFLAGSGASPFYAVASVTPAMMTILDAEALKVPIGLFLSKDEPSDVGERIVDLLRFKTFSSKCQVQTWGDMPHGFAGARGDLRSKPVADAYVELYTALARFFRSCQRADHTGQPVGPMLSSVSDSINVVEEDIGKGGLAKGETVKGKVRKEKRRRLWFGRGKAGADKLNAT